MLPGREVLLAPSQTASAYSPAPTSFEQVQPCSRGRSETQPSRTMFVENEGKVCTRGLGAACRGERGAAAGGREMRQPRAAAGRCHG